MKWKEKAASNYLDTYPYVIPGEGKKVKLKSHWKTETKIYEGNTCPHAEFNKQILIPLSVFKFIHDMEQKTSDEYLLYLEVEEHDSIVILKNPFIPKQTVTTASVEVEESFTPEEKTAVIHRHPSGLKSFSTTDYEYINRNNYISLLWVDKQFADATVKKKLPCGAHMMVRFNPEVYIVYEEDWKEKYGKLMEEAKEKIKKHTYSYSYKGNSVNNKFRTAIVFPGIDDDHEDPEELWKNIDDENEEEEVWYRKLSKESDFEDDWWL